MSNTLSFILLLPLILWATFQGLLYNHAGQVTETVNLAAFEGQKQASLQGYYSEDVKESMKDFLVKNYNIDSDKLEIVATDYADQKKRGERMKVCISIPEPTIYILDIFDFSNDNPVPSCSGKTDQRYYKVEKEIMSEYIDKDLP